MHRQMNMNAYVYYRCRATIKKKKKKDLKEDKPFQIWNAW